MNRDRRVNLSCYVPLSMLYKIESLARKREISKTEVVRKAIDRYFSSDEIMQLLEEGTAEGGDAER